MRLFAIKNKRGGTGIVRLDHEPKIDGEEITEFKEIDREPAEDERLDPATLTVAKKPYRELRREAYRREADPLLPEALYEWQFQGIELAATAWAQKQAEIRARFPKAVAK